MTFMPLCRGPAAKLFTLAVILGASLANPAPVSAFDGGAEAPSFRDGAFDRHDHRDHRLDRQRWQRDRAHAEAARPDRQRRQAPVYSGHRSGLPSILPGIGTYSGGVSALRVKGHGIYFSVDPLARTPVRPSLAPVARIVPVAGAAACSMEAGVCVIRPLR